MKIENAKKFIAVLTAFSLAFLQAVPVGGAVVNTNTLAGSDSGPTLTKSVGDTAEDSAKNQTSPAPAKTAVNTTDFQMSALSPLVVTTAPEVTVNATESTPAGKVTVSGSVTPNAKVYYSIKQGEQYLKKDVELDTTTSDGTFNREIELPGSGTYDILIYSKKDDQLSDEVRVTRTCTVPVPELTKATIPTADGKVTLEGNVTPNFKVYYSLKQGDKYLRKDYELDGTTSDGIFSREIVLPGSGEYDIVIYAKKTGSYANGIFISDTVSITRTCTVPAPTVMATVPTIAGKVTLSGMALPGYDVHYSLDGGKTYPLLITAKADGTWSKEITLSKTSAAVISVYAKDGAFRSETVNLLPAPTASLFTSSLQNPDSNGKVTLSGTAVAGYKIFYSVDGGVNWIDSKITAASNTVPWKVSGIALQHADETNILVAARKTTNSYAIQSSAATVPVNFSVATPTAVVKTQPDSNGKTTYEVTGLKGYSVYYSLDGGVWVDSKAVIPTSGTGTTGKITATVALQHAEDTQIRFSVVKKVAPTAVFQSAASNSFAASFPVATPTAVLKTQPNADGKTTYSVTGPKGYTIYYSLNGGVWQNSKAVIPTGGAGTTGTITATVALERAGDTEIRFMLEKKVGTTAVFQSAASNSFSANFPVATPTAIVKTQPNADGKMTYSVTGPKGYTIYYSLNGGVWQNSKAVIPTSGTGTTGTITATVALERAGDTVIRFMVVKKVGTAVFESAASDPFSVNFPLTTPLLTATDPTSDGKVKLTVKKGPVGYTLYYSLDGGKTYNAAVASEFNSIGDWNKTVTLIHGGETEFCSYFKKGNFQSETASVKVNFVINAPYDVTASVPNSTGVISLQGKRINSTESVFYSTDGGVTYKILDAFSGTGTEWHGTMTLPNFNKPSETTILMLATKTASGFFSEPVVVGVYQGLALIERTVLDYYNYVRSLFSSDYTVTVKPNKAVDPDWYNFSVVRFDQPGDGIVRPKEPGELAVLNIEMKVQMKDGKAVLVDGQRVFDEPVAQNVGYDTPVLGGSNPTVYALFSGLAQLLPPSEIDPRLILGTLQGPVNMNALKMIPDVELVFVEESPYIVHIKYLEKSYRISKDTTTNPESYKIEEESVFQGDPAVVSGLTNVTVTTPTSTGLVYLDGTRANPGDSIYYSVDGGVTYNFLAPGGLDTSWNGSLTLPKGDVTLSLIFKTKEGLTSPPVIVGSYKDLVPLHQTVVAYMNYLREIFPEPYILKAKFNGYASDPATLERYLFTVRLPSSDRTPGKLMSMDIYMWDFETAPTSSVPAFNAMAPYSVNPSSVPIELLLGGLALFLPPSEIDPRLIVGRKNMNALKLIPNITVRYLDKDAGGQDVVHITLQGEDGKAQQWRILYDKTFDPWQYKKEAE